MNPTLILTLSLLAPIPGPDPAPSTQPLEYPTVWEYRADGKVYRFAGTTTGTLTIEEAPKPLPGPTITALKNSAGLGVEQIRSGEVLVIEGVDLTKPGASLRVQIPGRLAIALTASPTRLEIRFPAVTEPVTGPLQLYWNSGTGWTLVATGPRITINPAIGPPARRPRIRSYHGLDGQLKQVFTLGEPILIRGEGFGSVAGEVEIAYNREAVLAWSDTEIRITNTNGANPWWPQRVAIRLPGWEGTQWLSDWMMGPKIVLPGQEAQPTPPPYPGR